MYMYMSDQTAYIHVEHYTHAKTDVKICAKTHANILADYYYYDYYTEIKRLPFGCIKL